MIKVLLGMSGGVDSSAAALLLKEKGYEVTGCTLMLFDENGESKANAKNAKAVCDKLGIEHITLDLSADFKEKVMDYFVSEYLKGRTPNPCIACNINIKFGAMLDFALENGFTHIATGHYAKIVESDGHFNLYRADDLNKDQSYVLYHLSDNELSHILFPLCDLSKSQIRELADRAGLITANKPDSQEICFIPDNDHIGFLERNSESLPPRGNFVDFDNNILGEHLGIHRYTIGQRKGLGVTFGKPMFVCDIDPVTNNIVLGEKGTEFKSEFYIENISVAYGTDTKKAVDGQIKIRYSAKPQDATVEFLEDNLAKVTLKNPARAVTSGQAAVLYDGEKVLLGGIIR